MQRKGFFYLAVTVISFSIYEVVSKTVAGLIDPVQLNFFLCLFYGGLLLAPLTLYDQRRRQLVSIYLAQWGTGLKTGDGEE